MRRALAVVALATVLVTAGCAGPLGVGTATETSGPTDTVRATDSETATPTPTRTDTRTQTPTRTDTPTADPDVTVEDGSLAVEADAVYGRVRALTGTDVSPPTVVVTDIPAGSPMGATPVHLMLGLERSAFPADRARGFTRYDGPVRFDPGGNRTSVERTLAHEFVHVVQFRTGMVERPGAYDARRSSDFRTAWAMVVEGGAVYVTDAYVDRHVPGARAQSTVMTAAYEAPPTPESRLALGKYRFGYRYVAANVDGPGDLAAAYDPFPRTTEQVLHDRTPDEEPPRALTVDHRTGDDWRALGRADRKGELFARVLLRSELDADRAAGAAAGWGNDRWRLFRAGEEYGLAWTLRYDSAAEADAFAAALRAFVEARRGATDGRFRVERPGKDTVVLFVGPDRFVDAAAASGDGEDVTVTVGDPE